MKFNAQNFIPSAFVLAVLLVLFASSTSAAVMPFRDLSCHSVISSDLKITSDGDQLNFSFEGGNPGLRSVLRSVLASNIPDSLVSAYSCIEIQASLPKSQCKFSAAHPELFECSAGAIEFQLKARLSCYADEADFFRGTAAEFSLSSARTGGRSKLQVRGTLVPTTGRGGIDFSPTAYEARTTVVDGIRQAPECTIDGAYLAP